ncbi:rhomboid family intramembrane serine protease [Aureibacter tunicatorum]|uniref:Membrane associated rhomboid family serine protease n=1 Tax=Aureibacter tunicatorum TaxID=866807 RepID=A0AAE3XNJ1_9BACT|nr:rhomboid family intramembrane serine protease [Aureibacter tunicatorum]MDR6238339.1 membrane associated rhomboid family serine protease [Aureibacter tunicatorum]BDD03371.1 rhomboid family intramembrane serine protease [Aureibacter tunicatorum]
MTYAILIITVLVSFYAFKRYDIVNRLLFRPYLIKQTGQYDRFLTSGFIHGDTVHLLFNMITFYFFGGTAEHIFKQFFGEAGTIYFGLFYLLGIIVANIPTFIKEMNNPNYGALGASGAVSAVLFFTILFSPTSTIYVYFFPIKAWLFGILYIAYTIYSSQNRRDNINHDAHLWGAVFGIIVGCLIDTSAPARFIHLILG